MPWQRTLSEAQRLHTSRIAGRDRHHWNSGRALSAGNPSGPRSSTTHQCLNNINQLTKGMLNYESSYKGFPPMAHAWTAQQNAELYPMPLKAGGSTATAGIR